MGDSVLTGCPPTSRILVKLELVSKYDVTPRHADSFDSEIQRKVNIVGRGGFIASDIARFIHQRFIVEQHIPLPNAPPRRRMA